MFKFTREFEGIDGEKQIVTIEVENDSLTIWEVKNMFIDFCKGCGYHPDSVKKVLGEYEEL